MILALGICMSETIEQIAEEVEHHFEEEVPSKTVPVKRRRRIDPDIPVELSKIGGDNVIKIMEFLHKKYLSWLREAEASKYTDLVKEIRKETMTELNQYYEQVFKIYEERLRKHEEMIERLTKMIDDLNNRIQVATEGEEKKVVVKQSVLEDPRVRALAYIVFEALSEKLPRLKDYTGLIGTILLPEMFLKEKESIEKTEAPEGEQQ